ncbi:hypothetical protein PRZ48_010683 [Zasmidium cellare]|uniref:Glutathione S-transferase n=1 Tax=Zasmidium cellare TaxID=395010 RepID=A0ABR0E9D5_ZASCE|nr:hypothetical protein PRZ48_010683 [Zasmidium cellare]
MSSIDYTLYYGMYSLCSMMVRYSVAVRGEHKDGIPTSFREVPALTSRSLEKPIADSLLITDYLLEKFPRLAPEEHVNEIKKRLRELHGLNYYSLSYSGTNRFTHWLQGELKNILKDDILKEYRDAIEYKLGVIEQEYVGGLKTETVEEMVERTRELLDKMSNLLPAGSKWLFGLEHPTALDAHLVPFLVRLKDFKRENLIPANLVQYVAEAEKTTEWRDVMGGRSTYSTATSVPATTGS